MSTAANDVADAIVAAMVELNFAATDIAKRKKPTLPPGKGLTTGRKAIVVSVGEEGDSTRITDRKTLNKYPAAVTIITTGGQQAEDDEGIHDMRQAIRKKLQDFGTFASVAGFNGVELFGGAPFNTQALDAALNYTIQTATVEVLESRI